MAAAAPRPDPVGMPKTRCRLVSLPRIALLLTAVAILFASLADTSFAASHATKPHKAIHASHKSVPTKKAHTDGSLPAQGIFDSCSISADLSTCEQDLQNIHAAGMQVAVLDPAGASLAQISAFATYAQSIGMSIMWELNDPGFWGGAWIGSSAAADWPSFSSGCNCSDTTQVLDYMIQFLGSQSSTYGYYAADDWTLTPAQRGGLTQYVNQIKAADPNHMVMIGSAEGDGTTYYSTGATIGNEIYPETTQSLMPYGSNTQMWQSIQQSIGQDQHAATSAGTSSAFILQAFTFGDNIWDGEAVGVCTASMSPAHCASLLQYPSASVQLELRNLVLQNAAPKLILWYTYAQASQGARWADLAGVVKAQYPASATAARAKGTRRASRKHGARRHSVGHTLAA
jgi:hypothetical protein